MILLKANQLQNQLRKAILNRVFWFVCNSAARSVWLDLRSIPEDLVGIVTFVGSL